MTVAGAEAAPAASVTDRGIGSSALLGWFILDFRKLKHLAEVEPASSKTCSIRHICKRVRNLRIMTIHRRGIGMPSGRANGKILSWVWAEGRFKILKAPQLPVHLSKRGFNMPNAQAEP